MKLKNNISGTIIVNILLLFSIFSCHKLDFRGFTKSNVDSLIVVNAASVIAILNVMDLGPAEHPDYGICFSSTNTLPTIEDSILSLGSIRDRSKYNLKIESLNFGTKYYFRAYIMDNNKPIYSFNRKEVTLPHGPSVITETITSIKTTTANGGGNVTSDGEIQMTSRGVCWSINQNPTTDDNKTIDGTGLGKFISAISGLALSTKYYVRAYVSNSLGTFYGNEIYFNSATPGLPIVNTKFITSISQNSAQSGGEVISDGGSSVIARGICWSVNQNPNILDSKTSNGAGIGLFSSNIVGLTPEHTYYVRAYATSDNGTTYGNQVSFTTSSIESKISGIKEIAIIGIENVIYHWGKGSINYPGQQFAGYGTFSDLSALRVDYPYTLPGTLTANDVVGVAIIQEGNTTPCYAWYTNGTVSKGYSNDLDAYIGPSAYTLPNGKSTSDIIAIGINPTNSNRCFTWYSDGTYSIGQLNDLDYYSDCQSFNYPGGSIVGIDFAYDGKVYTYYAEGTYSIGIPSNLAYYGTGYSYTVTQQ